MGRAGTATATSLPFRESERMEGRISLEFTIVPLRDETGQMIGMAAIMRDVTARFEEMRALRQKLAEASKPSG